MCLHQHHLPRPTALRPVAGCLGPPKATEAIVSPLISGMLCRQAPMGSYYQIRVRGRLGPEWAGWFDELSITNLADGDTLLSGPVADQAALHGILNKIRDLGLVLLALGPDPDQAGGRLRDR